MTVVDVSPKTYAEIRDRLRQEGDGSDVGNKLIHLHDIALREEEEGASEAKGTIVYIAFFTAFAAALIWLVTRIWR